jgi:hypothetical protein
MTPIGHYLRSPWDGIDAPVKRILMDIGEGMVWVAATFSLGLIIGAETTKMVIIDAAYRTPGIFGPSVTAGADYMAYWQLSKAVAIIGFTAALTGFLMDRYLSEE